MAKMLSLRPVNTRRGHKAEAYALPCGTYWVNGVDGAAIKLTVSEGPAGIGIRVASSAGAPRLTLTDTLDFRPNGNDGTWNEISACQYRTDAYSQAFRSWILGIETESDIALLGDEYRRKPLHESGGIVERHTVELSA